MRVVGDVCEQLIGWMPGQVDTQHFELMLQLNPRIHWSYAGRHFNSIPKQGELAHLPRGCCAAVIGFQRIDAGQKVCFIVTECRQGVPVNQALKRFLVQFCITPGHAVVQVLERCERPGGSALSNDVVGHGFQTADALKPEPDAAGFRHVPAHRQIDVRREQFDVAGGGLAEVLAGLVTIFNKSSQ